MIKGAQRHLESINLKSHLSLNRISFRATIHRINCVISEKQLLQKVFSRKFAANKAKKETKSDQWFELNIY